MPIEAVPQPRLYETVYVLRPSAETSEGDQVAERVREVVSRFDGKLVQVDTWGLRRLAYPIRKQTRGVYVYLKYASTGAIVAELERNLRLLDPVIRYQTVKLDEAVDLGTLEADPEQIKFESVKVEDDGDELSLEERLGMVTRARSTVSDDEAEDGSEDGSEDGDDEPKAAKAEAAEVVPAADDSNKDSEQ